MAKGNKREPTGKVYRHKHGRRPDKAYSAELARANVNEDAPQPLCLGRSDEFVDYEGYPPSAEEAAAMCAPCPLLEVCGNNARQQLPSWGVWGGIAWIDRRQAHLLKSDDPRWEWCKQDVEEI